MFLPRVGGEWEIFSLDPEVIFLIVGVSETFLDLDFYFSDLVANKFVNFPTISS